MFRLKKITPLAGRYLKYRVLCTKCKWEKNFEYDEIESALSEALIKLKREIIKSRYKKCPKCGAKLIVEENFAIS